jgi:arylamine N-acetyltransferase
MTALDGYLARLGLDHRPEPTLATLVDLHHRHLDRLPYDNLAPMLGRPEPTDPALTLERVAAGGNAGYCFHHNGLLELVLRELGFDVVRRGAGLVDADGVHGPTDHHVLVVSGLPTTDNPGGRWWPDVGFGDGFRDPLPLVPGSYTQGHFAYRLEAGEADRWTFRHDPRGSFLASSTPADPLTDAEVATIHRRLTTPPEGRYTRVLVIERRTADGIEKLRCVTRTLTAADREEEALTSYAAWRAELVRLGVSLAGVTEDELAALHARMLGAHEEWLLGRELAHG